MRIAVVEHRRKVSPSTRRALRTAVTDAGLEPVSWLTVPRARKARDAAAEAVAAGAGTVLVCGGDGTVRAAADALADTGVALAVLPTGTANLFAGGLGLPAEPAAVVELIVSGARRVLDTGLCNDRTFTVMAGVGLDAAMLDKADAAKGLLGKKRLGALSYFWAGVTEAHGQKPFDVDVTVDGAQFFRGPATCVLAGNLGELPGGISAFPDASPTDGLLDVGVVTAEGLRDWAALMVSSARGRQESSPHAQLGRGREIDVLLDGEHRIELDGGTKGTSDHLRIRVRPASLVVRAPS
ncbi:MAG TPA: diacylglycerol kinase family protein [Nakamurella sp.]